MRSHPSIFWAIEVGRRVSGLSLLQVRKGVFNVEDFGRARLLTHSSQGPFLVIQTEDETVIFNSKDPEQTREIYGQIRALIQRP